jgi:16S rRNA processing protein RimM
MTGRAGTGKTGTGSEQAPWVWLALIRHPQGRKGEVFAHLLTDFPEKFSERRELWLLAPEAPGAADPKSNRAKLPSAAAAPAEPRPIELVNHWLHKGGIVLHFAGIDSISAAETLTGLAVAIPRSERVALGEDEAYVGDLIGCTLVDLAGTGKPDAGPAEVGVIESVDRESGPVALLVVRSAGGGEILVPFAKSYLRRIDLDARSVEMELPAGLVDLNAPKP